MYGDATADQIAIMFDADNNDIILYSETAVVKLQFADGDYLDTKEYLDFSRVEDLVDGGESPLHWHSLAKGNKTIQGDVSINGEFKYTSGNYLEVKRVIYGREFCGDSDDWSALTPTSWDGAFTPEAVIDIGGNWIINSTHRANIKQSDPFDPTASQDYSGSTPLRVPNGAILKQLICYGHFYGYNAGTKPFTNASFRLAIMKGNSFDATSFAGTTLYCYPSDVVSNPHPSGGATYGFKKTISLGDQVVDNINYPYYLYLALDTASADNGEEAQDYYMDRIVLIYEMPVVRGV
jgi:hypothetical protein